MNNSVSQIVSVLLSFDEMTILTHVRPDGDTLGSAFALCRALEKVGKRVQVVNYTGISPRYTFLAGGKSDIHNKCFGKIVCVDVADPKMTGETYAEYAQNADVVIDHHPTNAGFGKLNLIDPHAAACGEIVLEIIKEICEPDKCIADCLYTAISTDTGCFVYANTTEKTHYAAAELIGYGADATALNKSLFRTKSKAAFEMERAVIENMQFHYDNKIVTTVIPLDKIISSGACEDDLDGVSSIPGQVSGVIASATFRQITENEFKISLRTNGEIDGGAVCKSFGGGGHKMAAGCTMYGDYPELAKLMAQTLYRKLK